METLDILKYIGLGLVGIVGFCIVLAVIGGILRLILDVAVCIIIAPFYILFHPVLFVTKPRTCLKNIIAKAPCYGDDFVSPQVKIDPNLLNHENSFIKEMEYFEKEEQFFRETY
jgi:hypothetical protein